MMRWFHRPHAWVLAALLPVVPLSWPAPAAAQTDPRETAALQRQIFQLNDEIQDLRAALIRASNSGAVAGGGGGAGGSDIAAQLLSRVQTMDEELRRLRGRMDEAQNQSDRRYAEMSKRLEDMSFQMNFAKSGAAAPAPAPVPPPVREVAPRPLPEPRVEAPPRLALPTPPPVVAPKEQTGFTFNPAPDPLRDKPPAPGRPGVEPARPVPMVDPAKAPPSREPAPMPLAADGKRTPELALQEGHAALARRDYAAAERSAREVMANRTSPRAYDGQFLLAEALSGQKQYAQAAIAFDDTYNRSHKGRHAEDSLVGLAGALTAINEKRAACDTIGRLKAEFPSLRADLKDTVAKTSERAGCAR